VMHAVVCFGRSGTQEHRNTGTQEHRNTGTQEHRNTGTQEHRNTGTQEHRNTGHHCQSEQKSGAFSKPFGECGPWPGREKMGGREHEPLERHKTTKPQNTHKSRDQRAACLRTPQPPTPTAVHPGLLVAAGSSGTTTFLCHCVTVLQTVAPRSTLLCKTSSDSNENRMATHGNAWPAITR